MTTVIATIGEDTVSADIHEMDIWQESLNVGRWQLILNNAANKWGGDFHTNGPVVLSINDVELLRGYVDDVQPYLDSRGVYTNLIKVIGRDHGRDLARLYLTASFVDKKGDDAIEDLLARAESEIVFDSLHTAPIVNMARNRTYLIDWIQDIGKRLNYDCYVDHAKTLSFFPVGAVSKHTSVDLKSIAAAVTNNILHLLKGEELGFSVANCVELSAGAMKDHWTDGNAPDFDPDTEDTIVVNEPITAGAVAANAPTATVFKTDLLKDTGVVVTNTPTTTVFKTNLTSEVDDYYNGFEIEFITGTLNEERQTISDYVGATKQITVSSAFSVPPTVGDTFYIGPPDDYYNGLAIEFTSSVLNGERKIISNYVGATGQITVQTAFSGAPSVGDTFVIEGCWVGISSIKFYTAVNSYPKITLDFSGLGKYNHAGLDLSPPTEMSFYVRHKCFAATASVRPRFEDAGGNVIEFRRSRNLIGVTQKGVTDVQAHNKWHKIQIPIGEIEENIIKDNESNNRWYYTTKIDEFDWSNVKKIIFVSAGATMGYGNFWIDNLCIPSVEVISIAEDAVSIAAYEKAMYFDQRNDIKSQIELDALTISELSKRKDPLQKIQIIASGQTGSRYAGVSLDVQAPGHGITDLTKYRIFQLHHKVRKNPINKGFDYTTEYDLIKHTINPTQVIDPFRVSLADDPVGTLINVLSLTRRRVRSAETAPRQEFGDTHPSSTVFFSGSGVAFPIDPEDGFVFILTADIPSTHLAGSYKYVEATTSWVRQPAIFRRATNPTFGQYVGDINENTTDGKIYQWTGSEWEFIGTSELVKMEGDLDDISDGTTYNKILAEYTDTGKALVKVLGQLEDELLTIGKIKDWSIGTTAPPSPAQGHIWLDTSQSPPQQKRWDGTNWVRMDVITLLEMDDVNLDNVADGATYGRILLTAIQAGSILLTEVIGDLSDIDGNLDYIGDGITYKKVTATEKTGASYAYLGLNANGVPLYIMAGTSFPITPALNMQFYRTDEKKYYRYTGAAWEMISAADLSDMEGDLDGITDGTTYKKVTATEKTGAGYAYLGLDANGKALFVRSGVSFPVTPSTDEVFYRTDQEKFYRWNGASWVLMGAKDLDGLPDGPTYGRVKLTSMQAGEILLAEALGDVDDLLDGSIYGKVKLTSLQSGKILLAEALGTLDNIANGTYGKVLVTAISGGKILVGQLDGNLDDMIDGDVFARMPENWRDLNDLTYIDGGKLYAGTWIESKKFRTAPSPNARVEFDSTGIRGFSDATALQFYLLASNGKAYCGAGTVILDTTGITIKGQGLTFRDSGDVLRGYVFGDSTYGLHLYGTTHIRHAALSGYLELHGSSGVYLNKTIIPGNIATGAKSDKSIALGSPSYPFKYYMPLYTSKPTPGSTYLGMPILVRSGSGVKSKIYICVQNDANVYEWVQIGVST